MGSGISLNKEQLIQIIKRELRFQLNENQSMRPRFTDDGYEIFYDYSDEVDLSKLIEQIEVFRDGEVLEKNVHK
jgi:hypothetical protein